MVIILRLKIWFAGEGIETSASFQEFEYFGKTTFLDPNAGVIPCKRGQSIIQCGGCPWKPEIGCTDQQHPFNFQAGKALMFQLLKQRQTFGWAQTIQLSLKWSVRKLLTLIGEVYWEMSRSCGASGLDHTLLTQTCLTMFREKLSRYMARLGIRNTVSGSQKLPGEYWSSAAFHGGVGHPWRNIPSHSDPSVNSTVPIPGITAGSFKGISCHWELLEGIGLTALDAFCRFYTSKIRKIA